MKGKYSAKHLRLRAYRNFVLDFLEHFVEYELFVVIRGQNIIDDGQATSSSTWKMPYLLSHQCTVEVNNKLDVPDNIRYWKIFGNGEKIECFWQSKDEFECANIDIDLDVDNNVHKKINKVELN